MDISQRGIKMPSSPIRKLVPYAEKAKSEGKKVYHLNIGQPDIDSPKMSLDAIHNNHMNILAYSLSQGNAPYREALCKYYTEKVNIKGLSPDNFIVTNGGSEALLFAFASTCDEGDEIVTIEPYYANYNGFAQSLGIHIEAVTSTMDNNFALPSMDEIEKKISPKTKAILINNPSNPIGCIYGKEELEKIKDIALKHNLYVISDEVYREYAYDGAVVHSILEFEELNDYAIVIDSESKRYSMCGLRIGSFITKNQTLYNTAMKFAQARLSPVLLGQIAATAAYNEYDSYTANMKTEFSNRRDLLVELLTNIPGVKCPMPGGAFYALAELPIDDSDKFAQWILEEFSYKGETVMLAPATGFYKNKEKGLKQVRIAYVLNQEELRKAMNILKIALEEYGS